MADRLRVRSEDLDWDPATYVTYYQGEPFTGDELEYASGDYLMCVSSYRDGAQHGPFQIFNRDGTVHEEGAYECNRRVRTYRERHPGGQLAEEYRYRGMILFARRRWSEDGRLIELWEREGYEGEEADT
jgi:antitoxin component YwqK of YwqJK toxin-antitoxin module